MRRVLPALALCLATALHAQPSCPTQAPTQYFALINACKAATPCLAGTPATLSVIPTDTSCFPPATCELGYKLQACDTVTWHFGDGTPDAVVTGQSSIAHTYASPGTYSPAVTISNARGSAQPWVNYRILIASNPPSYVAFSPQNVDVPETAGSVTFTLVRSGNLSIASTVHYAHQEGTQGPVNQGEVVSGNLTFAPGETTKSFSFHIYDDHMYTGRVTDYVSAMATDGTLFRVGSAPSDAAEARYFVIENDPQPTATVADARVTEGTETQKTADFVVTLSAPIGIDTGFLGALSDGTATWPSDYAGAYSISGGPGLVGCELPRGQTQCVLRVPIGNDDVPEPDETFTLVAFSQCCPDAYPTFTRNTATGTIVNDDAAITPASMQVPAGTRASLKLDIGQPAAAPLTIPLQSSSPEVLGVPASVTIDAGQHTATISAEALQAGLSRVTARVPGGTAPPALISVVDTVAVVAAPAAMALRAGSDATVTLSMQPPRATAQTVSLWSTRPDVATAPASLTIPAGGKAALTIHALESGAATIWIVTSEGFSFPVDVTVVEAIAPSVLRITPSYAPASGGSTVAFLGDGLDARCSVAFGATPATSVTGTPIGVSVVVPAHDPGVVDVTVVCGSARIVLPNAFTYFVPRRRAAG